MPGRAWLKPLRLVNELRDVDFKVSGNDVVIIIDQKYNCRGRRSGRSGAEHRYAQLPEDRQDRVVQLCRQCYSERSSAGGRNIEMADQVVLRHVRQFESHQSVDQGMAI